MGVMELDLRRPGRVEKSNPGAPGSRFYHRNVCFFLVRFFLRGWKTTKKIGATSLLLKASWIVEVEQLFLQKKLKTNHCFHEISKKTLAPQPSPGSWFVISLSFFWYQAMATLWPKPWEIWATKPRVRELSFHLRQRPRPVHVVVYLGEDPLGNDDVLTSTFFRVMVLWRYFFGRHFWK